VGYHSTRRRSADERRLGPLEVVCIAVVVAAVVFLLVWMIVTAGGGVLMN
jgi:hypothetical protein